MHEKLLATVIVTAGSVSVSVSVAAVTAVCLFRVDTDLVFGLTAVSAAAAATAVNWKVPTTTTAAVCCGGSDIVEVRVKWVNSVRIRV